MSKDKDPEQSPQPFAIRRGVGDHPGWGGLHRRGDPGAIPFGKAYKAENVRLGYDVINRPGLTKITTTTPTGEAFGLKEYGLDVSRGALLAAHNFSIAGDAIYYGAVSGYSPDWNETTQDLLATEIKQPTISNSVYPRKSMCVFKDIAYFVGGSQHYAGSSAYTTYLYVLSLPDEIENVSSFVKFSRVAEFPDGRVPHHLYAGESDLWIGCQSGHVMRWDGSALYDATASAAALTSPAVLVEFREKVYAIGQQQIKRWVKDDDWVAVTLSVGTTFIPKAAESINDYLYVVGRDGTNVVAYRWDGTTWTVKQTLADADNIDPWGGVDVCEWNGKAVWAFNRCDALEADAGAMVANLEDLTEIAHLGLLNLGRVGGIAVSGGALYACINENFAQDPPVTNLLVLDSASTIGGTWDSGTAAGWTSVKEWTDTYGPNPAADLVDMLPV